MSENTGINFKLSHIGSAVVVISYFLLWNKSWFSSETGLKLLGEVLKGVKELKGENALPGLGLLLFIISPILFHALNLLLTVVGNGKAKLSLMLTSLPAGVWVSAALLLLIKSKGDTFILKIFFPHEIGAIITMIGMALGIMFSAMEYLKSNDTVVSATSTDRAEQIIKIMQDKAR
jgi:hypothetical protein